MGSLNVTVAYRIRVGGGWQLDCNCKGRSFEVRRESQFVQGSSQMMMAGNCKVVVLTVRTDEASRRCAISSSKETLSSVRMGSKERKPGGWRDGRRRKLRIEMNRPKECRAQGKAQGQKSDGGLEQGRGGGEKGVCRSRRRRRRRCRCRTDGGQDKTRTGQRREKPELRICCGLYKTVNWN